MKRIEEIEQIAKRLMGLETTIRITTDKELKYSVMKEVMEITEELDLDDMLAIDEYIMSQIDN